MNWILNPVRYSVKYTARDGEQAGYVSSAAQQDDPNTEEGSGVHFQTRD